MLRIISQKSSIIPLLDFFYAAQIKSILSTLAFIENYMFGL